MDEDKKDEVVEEIKKDEENETNNTLKISNEAIATYAGIAVNEVAGVYGMSGGLAGRNK